MCLPSEPRVHSIPNKGDTLLLSHHFPIKGPRVGQLTPLSRPGPDRFQQARPEPRLLVLQAEGLFRGLDTVHLAFDPKDLFSVDGPTLREWRVVFVLSMELRHLWAGLACSCEGCMGIFWYGFPQNNPSHGIRSMSCSANGR